MTMITPVHTCARRGLARRAHNPSQISIDVFEFLANSVPNSPQVSTSAARQGLVTVELIVEDLPRVYRQGVEDLMVEYLPTPEPLSAAVDILEAQWFTAWRRGAIPGTVSCREIISAPEAEIKAFNTALAELQAFILATEALKQPQKIRTANGEYSSATNSALDFYEPRLELKQRS